MHGGVFLYLFYVIITNKGPHLIKSKVLRPALYYFSNAKTAYLQQKGEAVKSFIGATYLMGKPYDHHHTIKLLKHYPDECQKFVLYPLLLKKIIHKHL